MLPGRPHLIMMVHSLVVAWDLTRPEVPITTIIQILVARPTVPVNRMAASDNQGACLLTGGYGWVGAPGKDTYIVNKRRPMSSPNRGGK